MTWNSNIEFVVLSLGVVVGLGLAVLVLRAVYIHYAMSQTRRATSESIQTALTREIAMQQRRRSRRVARSGRARGDFFDLESGLREPPPVHFARDYEEPLPIYELPPEYSAIAKPNRRMDLPSDLPIPYDEIYPQSAVSSGSSSRSSTSSTSRETITRVDPPDDPVFFPVTVR